MKNFDVGNMTCAACSARVEKTVSSLDGVEFCSVNLLTNSMQVDGTATNEEIISAVEKIGYTASLKGEKQPVEDRAQKGDKLNLKRLFWSIGFVIILMYVSMGHSMWGWYLPKFLSNNPMSLGLVQFILSAIVLVINQRFFINGFKAVKHKAPNMDTLVSLGSGASFIYSTIVLFEISFNLLNGNTKAAFHCLHNLYFESAAMILALISFGKILEEYSKGKTTDALNSLIDLSPKKASLVTDGGEELVDATFLKKGDIIAVRPGESFAADGIIIEGESSVDESILTGESIPLDKKAGDRVSCATVNKSGFLKCEVINSGEDTILASIIKTVKDSTATKAPIARIADKVSGVFVPAVLLISLITLVTWLVLDREFSFAISRAISVLVISCPCALGLATPVAIMVSGGIGAKNGILFKNATSLENLGKINTLVFDKTGTVTKGKPQVTDIILCDVKSEDELLCTAYSIEIKSGHPLSLAVIDEAKKRKLNLYEAKDFTLYEGNGVSGICENRIVYGGKSEFIEEKCKKLSDDIKDKITFLAKSGKTPMIFAEENKILGIIAVADAPKADAKDAIKRLHSLGIKTVMLTGDNEHTADYIANQTGIQSVIAKCLPNMKAQEIENLKKSGTVAMVGDGINDAPALAAANTGIAVCKGTDIAIESADVVLMKDSLLDIPAAIVLSRLCLKNIKQNLFWAFIYNSLGIPLAAGAFIGILGWQLTPMFGAAAMSLSSFCVVSNALRLNIANIYNVNIKQKNKKGKEKMEKIIKIEGMMCPHCEARVKQLLEEIDGVEEAVTSHKEGIAKLSLEKNISDAVFEKAITDAGYKVVK